MAWLVDGMNLIGSHPDGWWRDRERARRDLVERLAALVETGDTVTVVFDGRDAGGEVADGMALGVTVVFAPGGPNAADDVLVALAGEGDTVVTSDTGLARRLAVPVLGVRAFRRLLDAPPDDDLPGSGH